MTAQGIPKPDAQWLHSGKPIKADDRVKIIQDGNLYKVDITEAKLGDAGTYQVSITNKLGEEVRKAELSVSRKFEFRSFPYFSLVLIVFLPLLQLLPSIANQF